MHQVLTKVAPAHTVERPGLAATCDGGLDPLDSTSADVSVPDYSATLNTPLRA